MSTGANDRWLLFEQLRHPQDVLTTGRACPTDLEVGEEPAGTFNTKYVNFTETNTSKFVLKVFRTVEVRGREVPWVAGIVPVLTVHHGPMTNRDDMIVQRWMERQAVQRAGIPGDSANKEDPLMAKHALGLVEGYHTVGSFRQVVERSEQQDGVD